MDLTVKRDTDAPGIPVAGGHRRRFDGQRSGIGVFFLSFRTIPFIATDVMDPKLTRQFNSISQIAEEHKNVRVWGGIHFRNSLDVGDDMGRKIAVYLIDNSLTPAR